MKRHIAWLLSCGLLVGCGATPPPIDEPPAPTPAPNQSNSDPAHASSSPSDAAHAPAAFHFKSGVLEIGDFDPYTLGDNIFDPCTEISPEEFAAAGFDNVEPLPEEYAGLAKGLSVCTLTSHANVESELIGNNNSSFDELSERLQIRSEYKSNLVPSIFVYEPPGGQGLSCYAQVDTKRGGIVASSGTSYRHPSGPDICATAVENLEKLGEKYL